MTLANCRIGLYLHQQGIDTTTPAGKAMFQMCGVFAEFERDDSRAHYGGTGCGAQGGDGSAAVAPSVGADLKLTRTQLFCRKPHDQVGNRIYETPSIT